MTNFEGFDLSENLLKSLAKMNYSEPTPIQEQAIPHALKGRDVLGSAQTGTGKTAAFSIPLVQAIMKSDHGTALVMTPTRELAKQVLDVIHQLLGHQNHINTAFIIGGDSMGKQLSQLKRNPRIIVGTPGRINDHLERGTLDLSDAGFLVLDETDRMLDMGFGVQLDRIMKYMPEEHQTLMFSATMPNEIVQISKKYLTNPERISIGATNVIAPKIKQEAIRIEQPQKYQELQTQLHERTGSVIIFIKTKYGADRMAKNLRRDGFTSDALHGDLRQNKRDKVMKNFRESNFRILVATDIAARGLDVPHIEHVINYDLPQVAEDYIHRMGRTARAGAEGSALSFVASQDVRKWRAIEILLDPDAKHEPQRSSNGKKPRRSGGGRPGQKPHHRKGGKPGQKFGKKPGERSKYKPKGKPGQKFAGKPAAKTGEKPAHHKGSGKPHRNAERNSQRSSEGKPHGKPHGKPNHKGKSGKPSHAAGEQSPKRKSNGKPHSHVKPHGKGKPAHKSGGKKSFGGGKPQGGRPNGRKPHGGKPGGKKHNGNRSRQRSTA